MKGKVFKLIRPFYLNSSVEEEGNVHVVDFADGVKLSMDSECAAETLLTRRAVHHVKVGTSAHTVDLRNADSEVEHTAIRDGIMNALRGLMPSPA